MKYEKLIIWDFEKQNVYPRVHYWRLCLPGGNVHSCTVIIYHDLTCRTYDKVSVQTTDDRGPPAKRMFSEEVS